MTDRRTFAVPFDAGPEGASIARCHVRQLLVGEPETLICDAVMATSELVTNAIVHGRGPRCVEGSFDPHHRLLYVMVVDGSGVLPAIVADRPLGTGGLGLHIVSSLASDWGAIVVDGGTQIWFTIDDRR